jgi:GrpB-like predicted nucleotidyltransferase (UPF0157 family)
MRQRGGRCSVGDKAETGLRPHRFAAILRSLFVCESDGVLTAEQIGTFDDAPPPPGKSPWVDGQQPDRDVRIVAADPSWPRAYARLAERIISALGDDALRIEHVGSTSVPGLAAKPVIDIDLIVEDSGNEQAYVPALEQHGFVLVIREPWWYEHRCLRHHNPASNLHVFSPESPEAERHCIFRDWLRNHPEDRALYQTAKVMAADDTRAVHGHAMDYNGRKEDALREIYGRAFRSLGLTK